MDDQWRHRGTYRGANNGGTRLSAAKGPFVPGSNRTALETDDGIDGSNNNVSVTDSVADLLLRETSIAQLRNFLVRLEDGDFRKIAEQRIAELKNLSLASNESHMTAHDREMAKKADAARKELLPVPTCVCRILKGDYTYISDDHKRLIQDCVPWTIKALKHAYLDQEIKRHVRLLLGTFQFTQCLSWAQPSWPRLMNGLRNEMLSIGRELHDIYVADDLHEILGTLNPPLLANTNYRQDCPGGPLVSCVCFDVAIVACHEIRLGVQLLSVAAVFDINYFRPFNPTRVPFGQETAAL